MTVSRKEKILIFVLIIFLLVAGTFTLVIMPMNNDKKAAVEAVEKELEPQAVAAEKAAADVSDGKFNTLVASITAYEAELKILSSPGKNLYEEVLAGSLRGQSTSTQVARTLRVYMSERGINPSDFTVNAPVVQSGSKIYTVGRMTFTAANSSILLSFVDEVAKVVSYNISYLSFSENADGTVTGVLEIKVTYLDV